MAGLLGGAGKVRGLTVPVGPATSKAVGPLSPIPQHKPLRLGTLHAILRAVSQHKGVPLESILD
jgi:hypothetical protein